jgi:hypothetical protein
MAPRVATGGTRSAGESWTGYYLDLRRADGLVVAGHEDGSDGLTVAAAACDSRGFRREVAIAPLHQREQRNGQLAALLAQPVLEAWRTLTVGASLQDPFGDEPREAISEDVSRHAQALLELVEAAQAEEGIPDDQQRPALPHELEGARDRAVLTLVGSFQHAHSVSSELREATGLC